MKAVPVEKINKIIDSVKRDLAIELLKAIVETHAVEIPEELDHPNFIDLVARIRKIDSAAADWIIFNQDIFQLDKAATNLTDLMRWSRTPQGEEYWHGISKKLGE